MFSGFMQRLLIQELGTPAHAGMFNLMEPFRAKESYTASDH
jgi:hypothetical protein